MDARWLAAYRGHLRGMGSRVGTETGWSHPWKAPGIQESPGGWLPGRVGLRGRLETGEDVGGRKIKQRPMLAAPMEGVSAGQNRETSDRGHGQAPDSQAGQEPSRT